MIPDFHQSKRPPQLLPEMPPKKKIAAAAAAPLKPQGATNKRTPQSAFDGAAGKDVYEPEKVVAQRTAKGGARLLRRRQDAW